jgi:hypothetical protein
MDTHALCYICVHFVFAYILLTGIYIKGSYVVKTKKYQIFVCRFLHKYLCVDFYTNAFCCYYGDHQNLRKI